MDIGTGGWVKTIRKQVGEQRYVSAPKRGRRVVLDERRGMREQFQ